MPEAQRNPSELIPYANNAKTHSTEQINLIASSIKEFGFNAPVLIDGQNGIIAGHGRVSAALKLGLVEVPVVELKHFTSAQKKAYILADNRLGEVGTDWNLDLVSVELESILDSGNDISLTGFDESFLILDEVQGLTDEDAVPEVPDEPLSVLGDIFTLGNHRLMCGDSTSIDAVELLMDGQKADMVFTDPPYGMSYGGGRAAGSTEKGALLQAHGEIIGDDLREDELLAMISNALLTTNSVKKEGAAGYVCFTWRTYREFESALILAQYEPKACIVWDKKSIGLGRSNYRPQHEFIFYCDGQWFGDKSESDVWYMSRGATGQYVHPTQKPVELIERAIKNSSKGGDAVMDIFGGSGSTLIACEKTNRNCRMMELDPKYVDVIINRWQDFTGLEAVDANGVKFNERCSTL